MIHAGFVLIGVVTTMLGPLLPMLQAKWSLNDSQAGYLFTAQFATSIIGTALLSEMIKRFGLLRSLAASYALMAVGAAGLGAGGWTLGIVAVSCYGFALGVAIPGTNILIAEMNPERRAARLNILNFIWCAGAVACPAAVALFVREERIIAPLAGLAMLLAGIAALLVQYESFDQPGATGKKNRLAQSAARRGQESRAGASNFASVWRSSFAYVIAALLFLYVGAENSIAGWVATYTGRMNPSMASLGAWPQSIFWAAVLVGRLTAPVALRRLSEERLVLTASLVSLLGASLLLITAQMSGLLIGAMLAGLGFAAIYPTTVAIFMKHYSDRATASAAPIFAMGALGGATLPWVVGFVSTQLGSLRAGLLVPLIVNAAMIALEAVVIMMLVRARADADAKV
ncbi:MAG TPA: MFS transporter [Blastocatellia bacterium]|nr:MFS transporter [Blastocatellia bacterium]